MSLFKIWFKLIRNNPKEFHAIGVEVHDRESLFYADSAKLHWASASGLL